MGFCDSSQTTSAPPVWADPLGPTSTGKGGRAIYGTSGAPQLRNGIFNAMSGYTPQLNAAAGQAANTLSAGMSNPAWQEGQNLATRNLSGAYLNGSPQLDKAMAENRSATMAASADQNARTQSQFAKAGMGWSTANQQATQAGTASAAGNADRDAANTYLQNYQFERGNQNAAPQQFAAASAAPFNYLSQGSQATLAPLAQQGNILSALSSGGQVVTPNTTQSINPSTGSSILNGWAGVVGNL